MNTKNQIKTNKIARFLKESIFFRVPKDEKAYVKTELMNADHNSFRKVLVAVIIFQIIMVLYKLFSTKFVYSHKDWTYIGCYLFLIVGCIVCYFLSEHFYKRKKQDAYFVLVAIAVNMFYIWSLGITLLDSLRGPELTTISYVSLAMCSLVILEPWVFMVDAIGYIAALNIIIAAVPQLKWYPSVLISSISIAVLTAIIATINFSRRIKSTILQKQVGELNTILTRHAYYDELTSIFNRRYLTEHINDRLSYRVTPSGVAMFDIDDFKKINDDYGHQNGDICLSVLGDIINEFIKSNPNSYAVRYGGEEFLIFFPNIKDTVIKEECEKLRKAVNEKPIQLIDGSTINLSISIGASLAKPGQNYYKLIEKADDNLYVAKASGKNIVYFE